MHTNTSSKILRGNDYSMERMAKHYYEKEEYVTDAELYAKEVRESREKLVNRYVPTKATNLLELGCGSGILKNLHPNWIGLDISSTALKYASPSSVVTCDVQNMPIGDDVIDAIVSFNTLEHIQNPEQVLEECCRVLLPGGILLFQEAWFCEFTHTNSANFAQKIAVAVKRLAKELTLLLGVKNMKLKFRKMKPNYNRIGKDWDAVSSIDPHDMLCWFRSRGYIPLNEIDGMLLRCLRKEPFKDREKAMVIKKV